MLSDAHVIRPITNRSAAYPCACRSIMVKQTVGYLPLAKEEQTVVAWLPLLGGCSLRMNVLVGGLFLKV